MAKDEVFSSWFEDGPQVQKALAKLPRTDQAGMTALVMTDILPDQARGLGRAVSDDGVVVAGGERKPSNGPRLGILCWSPMRWPAMDPLGAIPIMAVIAMQTVRATLLGGW